MIDRSVRIAKLLRSLNFESPVEAEQLNFHEVTENSVIDQKGHIMSAENEAVTAPALGRVPATPATDNCDDRLRELDKTDVFKSLRNGIREAERLSADDYAIRINVRDL